MIIDEVLKETKKKKRQFELETKIIELMLDNVIENGSAEVKNSARILLLNRKIQAAIIDKTDDITTPLSLSGLPAELYFEKQNAAISLLTEILEKLEAFDSAPTSEMSKSVSSTGNDSTCTEDSKETKSASRINIESIDTPISEKIHFTGFPEFKNSQF